MAATAKFIGDFSSFTDAVKKAVVSLDSLEVNSSKVQSALQRMTTGFQGQKLIQDALLATEAVNKIGGATALTEKEQKQLNAQLTEAIAKYGALGKTAPADMQALAKATAGASSATSQWMGDFTSQVTGMATGMISAQAVIGGVQAAIGGLVSFVGSSVSSFAAAEAAEKKMTVALTNMGLATPATVDQMNDLAGSFQKTTIYGDDLISEMQALLMQIGGVAPHAMEDALRASTDLAAGLGVDLETATTLVAKAFAGKTEALGKYGIKIDEAALKTEGMSAVLDGINARFGGQAQAATETYAGKVAQLANEYDNLKEAVGKFIVEQPLVIGLLRDLTTLFKGTGEEAEGMGNAINRAILIFSPSLSQALHDMNEHYRQANELAALVRETQALLPKTPASYGAPKFDPWAGLGDQSAVVAQQIADAKAQDKAKKAADQHAAALRQIHEDLYGASAIAQAKNYTAVVTDVSRLSAEGQARVNKVVAEGIAVYQRLGQVAPEAMRKLYIDTITIPPAIAGIGSAAIGTQIALKDLTRLPWPITDKIPLLVRGAQDGEKALVKMGRAFGQEMNRSAAEARKFFAAMEAEIARAAQIGERFATTLIGAIQSKSGIGKALGAQFGGDLGNALAGKLSNTLTTALGTKLGGALGGMLGPLGAAAGEMLGKLTDKLFGSLFGKGAGRQAVIDFADSMGGFDALQKKLEALGEQGGQLWVKLTQGVPKGNVQAAKAAIAEVEAALAAAEQKATDAGEAAGAITEEQALATIETATQASQALESLGPKIQENEAQWKAWGDAVTAQIDAIAARIRAMPMPPVLSAGAASNAVATGATSGSGGGTAVLNVDGRMIAEAVVPNIPGVVKQYGLA